MAREDIVVGLDVGTSKIAAVIGDVSRGVMDHIEIIGVGVAESTGLRKGVVVDIEKATSCIRQAVEAAEIMAGVQIGSVYTGISGGHVMGRNVPGLVAVSGDNHVITREDVNRVINAAKTTAIPPEREVLHILPQGFTVDGEDGIRDPVGMTGVRLEVTVHIVTGAVTSAANLIRSVHLAGLSVEDVVLEPLASSEAVLTDDEMQIGTALVDMGSGTTDIVVYKNGALMYTASLSIGGWHITNDLAMGLRMTPSDAETLKRNSGSALVDLVDDRETISVTTLGANKPKVMLRRQVAEIVQPRMMEMLDLIHRELEKSQLMLPGGVVLTGGTSLLEGIQELSESMFNMPVRIGYPRQLKGLSDRVHSPIHATGVGLLLYGTRERWSGKGNQRFIKGNLFDNILKRMKSWYSYLKEDYF
jgi:cell division protein FtsA